MPGPDDLNFYKEYPKSCDPEDFWGQVKRTVNGKPVSKDQIDLIVEAVINGLDLIPSDNLLDLCCGNGALSSLFFSKCKGGVGVDFSEYLIQVAHKHFQKPTMHEYILDDVITFVSNYADPERFTKAICYGSISYLPREKVYELLGILRKRFTDIRKLFIGNIPDKSMIHKFFDSNYQPGIEDSPGSPIGVWWSTVEFEEMAEITGWHLKLQRMPDKYYTAHYRFDAILTPLSETSSV